LSKRSEKHRQALRKLQAGPLRSFSQWNEIYGDTVIATAILDRILHHQTTINIKVKLGRGRGEEGKGLDS
jgi:DNA replication protein DnaC